MLPLGTFNHFAKDLGIPLDPEAAVKTIAGGVTKRTDVGEVNDRIFVNNSSLGIYPDIVAERDSLRQQGRRKSMALMMAGARVLRHYRGMAVTITAGESTRNVRTPFLFVGNNDTRPKASGSVRGQARRGAVVRVPRAARPWARAAEDACAGARRPLGQHQTLESFAAGELQIDTAQAGPVRVALDGEIVLMDTPLRYRVRPLALEVIVPDRDA